MRFKLLCLAHDIMGKQTLY